MRRKYGLLLIDLQRDFLEDTGKLPVDQKQCKLMIKTINNILEKIDPEVVIPIYIINQFPKSAKIANIFRKWAAIEGTPGAELDPRIALKGGDQFVKKAGDAFSNPELDQFLKKGGITDLILTGVFANHCVLATLKGALKRNYHVTILSDGIATGNNRALKKAMKQYKKRGAVVSTSERVLASIGK